LSRSVSRPRKFHALTHTVDRHLFEKIISVLGVACAREPRLYLGSRLFYVRRTVKPYPLDDRSGSWVRIDPVAGKPTAGVIEDVVMLGGF
jgi:hypothetical protein